MKNLKRLVSFILTSNFYLLTSILCLSCTPAADNEVALFITLGQSNADGSAFADSIEDSRLSQWYDRTDRNPQQMQIWYRSCYIVNEEDGARWVYDGTTEDAPAGWMNLYYKNDNQHGRTMMNMIHQYGTWSEGAAGRRGMEGEFGMHFAEAFPDKELYILKLGCSGSYIESWASPDDSHNWNYFYEKIYQPAIADLLAKGKRPRLAGIWWMQGESNQYDTKEQYLALLKRLIEQCRTRLGFPDAHIYMGRVVKPGESEVSPEACRMYGQGVRDAQDAVADPQNPDYVQGVTIIDGRDCPFDKDNLHYGHVGINRIGRKIATEVIEAGKRNEWARMTSNY